MRESNYFENMAESAEATMKSAYEQPEQCEFCEVARLSSLTPTLDLTELKKVLDRDWHNETPEQVIIIAGNGIHWRDIEIAQLKKQLEQAQSVTPTKVTAEMVALLEEARIKLLQHLTPSSKGHFRRAKPEDVDWYFQFDSRVDAQLSASQVTKEWAAVPVSEGVTHGKLLTRIEQLESAIRWALGEFEDFGARLQGDGPYWWRTELRLRSELFGYVPSAWPASVPSRGR